jgi:predicted acylesterase/phospholipase RssA
MRDFFISYGVTPDLNFATIKNKTLILVATDLNSTSPVLYGLDPEQSILDGLLASTAIPPWIAPLHKEDRWLMDGGLVSNLSIESAIKVGATEIIALDLLDMRNLPEEPVSVSQLLNRIITTVGQRQVGLELALAAAHGIPVHRLNLLGDAPVMTWDFSHTAILIERGYETAQQEMDGWEEVWESKWTKWFNSIKQSVLARLQG